MALDKLRSRLLKRLEKEDRYLIIRRMPEQKRLFLVDGMANIFRAFYAVRGLSNSKGLPTNAVFGFTMMLRKLLKNHKPDYIGVVLDSKEKTFRHEQYEEYKANRMEMPENLETQLPYIERVCAAYRVPILKMPRFEADDLIGTLANKAASKGIQSVIVSGDKDLCQLVRDPDIIVLKDDKGNDLWLDEAGVLERLGVRPDQVVDCLGLMGDSADNIPGAPGIGEKGAVALISQFGTIDAALAGWESVTRKAYRESLRDNAELILKSRELAQVDVNAPVELDLDSLVTEEPDRRAAYALFKELEFSQLAREFADDSEPVAPVSPQPEKEAKYRRLSGLDELRKLTTGLLAAEKVAFAFNVAEVSGKAQSLPGFEVVSAKLKGIAFASRAGVADYLDLTSMRDRESALGLLREVLGNGLVSKAVHGFKRAITIAGAEGIDLAGIAWDTELQGYLLEPERSSHDLALLSREYLGEELASSADAAEAALRAADVTLRLAEVLEKAIEDQGLVRVYKEAELPLVPVLVDMEQIGFRVDRKALGDLSVELDGEISRLTREIYALAGEEFNINSPQQLGEVFERLNFEVSKKTKTGKIQTNREVLDELALKYELPRLVIDYREITKLKSTYADTLPLLIDPRDGRIHTTLNQTGTATGRLSSENPNLQNIPIRTEMGRHIRRAFIPEDGWVLLSADYSQIELRLLAHVTDDPEMLEAFQHGEDIHSRTARAVFGAKTDAELKEKRRVAKIVNFAIAYAVGPFGLAPRVGISRQEAKKVIDDYYRTYTGVRRYMEEMPEKVREAGGIVRSLLGRLRRLPDISSRNHNLRARAEREAINMPMQGSASDIVKLAMLKVHAGLRDAGLKSRMILQIHDELVFEVPRNEVEKASGIIKAAMEDAFVLKVPLLVEIGYGTNWMEAKP